MVRRLLPALASTLVLGCCAVFGQEQFPYMAYTTEANVYVRSGPGQRYYPTQELPKGFAVEVYRHDEGGWCAIRPPAGSFSWVPAHQLSNSNQKIAEVTVESAVAHVGSSLSPTRSSIQVLLQRGEKVEVLDLETAGEGNWVRIAAPAGEFRWLSANQISRQPPLEVIPPVQTASAWAAQTGRQTVSHLVEQQQIGGPFAHLHKASASIDAADSNSEVSPAVSSDIQNNEAVIQQDTGEVEVVTGSPAEQVLQQQGLPGNDASLLQQSAQNMQSSTALPRIRFRGLSASSGPIGQRIEELQLRLSEIVVRQPQEWQFDQVQSEATSLLDKSESSADRAQLRELLDRIAKFQNVQKRYAGKGDALASQDHADDSENSSTTLEDSFTGLTAQVRDRANDDLASSENSSGESTDSSKAKGPLYDAVGLLKPVASKRANAPRYALVDDKGDVLSFVTPSPDLNLQPYVGRRIGVHGKRGFMPEYRRAHVTAGRITPIEDRLRR